MSTPICPYCGRAAQLVDSAVIYGRSYGTIWLCAPCDAYVGCHKNSKKHAPLGRLANAELRALKMKAHAAFDPLWKEGKMARNEAYRHLQELLGETHLVHIGFSDEAMCRRIIKACGGEV